LGRQRPKDRRSRLLLLPRLRLQKVTPLLPLQDLPTKDRLMMMDLPSKTDLQSRQD
jgi:hypothetical protein